MGKYPEYAEVVSFPELDVDVVTDYEDHSKIDDRLLRDVRCDILVAEKVKKNRIKTTQRINNANSPYEPPLIIFPGIESVHSGGFIRSTLSWIGKIAAGAYAVRKFEIPKKDESLVTLVTRRGFLTELGILGATVALSEVLHPIGLRKLGAPGKRLASEISYRWNSGINLNYENATIVNNLVNVLPQIREDYGLEGHIVAGAKIGHWHADPGRCNLTFEEALKNPEKRQATLEEYAEKVNAMHPYFSEIEVQRWDPEQQRYAESVFYDPKTCTRKRVVTTSYEDPR